MRATILGIRASSFSTVADFFKLACLLEGSWEGISGVISTILLAHIRGLITLLITTHEPPSACVLYARSERQSPTTNPTHLVTSVSNVNEVAEHPRNTHARAQPRDEHHSGPHLKDPLCHSPPQR